MTDRFRIPSNLGQRLNEHRLELPTLLRRAGLPVGFFDQEKIHATTAELFALWRAIGEVSTDPAIGLKLGSEPRMERFQPTMIAALCSRTFRDAVQRMGRYKQLTCPEEIRLHREGEGTAVEFVFPHTTEDEPATMIDNCLAWILYTGRRGTEGRIVPLHLELMRPAKDRELLESHFGCRVRFRSERNALVFRTSDMDLAFTTHNVELLQAVGAQLEQELEAHRAGPDVGAQVKHALKRSLAGKRPTLHDIGRELGVSTRTLQRRLADAGITFQHVVEEARRELAHHYLRQSTVELNEAAYLLGYADPNSFFRAFNGWEGVSPGEWRTRHREVAEA
ncbi:MAG TPA: AraC family transcriptional regulator ligand-binding domain-containing protein [Flavobacteriales bacterium]|jgi:AraC-like DNA-binding protein|nr:AraC family transcriptional regulator ligand-binding domain-containing protein [Flavobacteriales bacterium]